jgi:CPA2 family monovalent cation:H+ antiporter-2
MPHSTPLITTIVGGLVLAFILAGIAVRLKLPPLVGYLCAGIVCGPHTPGFTADSGLANELAELGVILLMFGVGLHFSLKDLLSVKNIAVPGAIVQIAAATALGLGLSQMMGWNMGAGLLFGLALSVASTVVLIKAMEERGLVDSSEGRIAIGWLIVEDLAMVAALVLIPALSGVLGGRQADGGGASLWAVLGLTLVKVAAFVAVMLVIGRRVVPWLLERVVFTGNRELFRLGVLACALGIAYGATALFGVSFALGAFFAGMVMAESEFSQRAADESLPLRDAFSVLFFVSVGMLFDPLVLLRDPWGVLATFLIILIGKSIAAYVIVRAFRHPKLTALTISVSLAQIGEFSFILAGLGVTQEILPKAGQDLVLAGSILSILVNPVLFNALDRYRSRTAHTRLRPEEPDPGV